MRNAYIVVFAAVIVALWRGMTPAPAPADATPDQFSAVRAFPDIEAIAQHPHPVGTVRHARVRDYLVRRLEAMGLTPELQSERITSSEFGSWTVSAPVTNIAAVLKGKDPAKPAVLVMSHYDTVPNSPGAADDTTGVAASLEILRAMQNGPRPDHDVIFLITDGEELGLVGATAFFRNNPLAKRVGAVVNFEARGDCGLASMFETGPRNADTVALWAARAPRPVANSLSQAIYARMPNGSDFTLALKRGLPGVNIAFIGCESAYHTPLAAPWHLDRGSVQHLGEGGLAAVRAFAAKIPEQKSDAVYSDVLGFFLVQYGAAVGWILFVLAAGLSVYAVITAHRVAPASWWRGFAAMAVSIVVPVALLFVAGLFFGNTNHFLRVAHFDALLAGAGAIAVGGALLGANLFKKPAAVWQAFLLSLVVLGGVMQALLPEGAFVLVWPALAAAVVAIVRFKVYGGEDRPVAVAIAMIVAVLFVAQAAMSGIFVFTAVGVDLPAVLYAPLIGVMPLILLVPGRPCPRWVHAAVAASGLALFGFATVAPNIVSRPAPSLIRYVADLDSGKAYIVDYLDHGDAWTKAALGDARRSPLPWSENRSYWWAPAAPVAVPKTDLSLMRAGEMLVVKVAPQPRAYSVMLSVRATAGLAQSTFEGEKIAAIAPDTWHRLRYYVPGSEGLVWAIPAPKKGKVEVTATTLYRGWPRQAVRLPPLPDNKMRFNNSQTTETLARRSWEP